VNEILSLPKHINQPLVLCIVGFSNSGKTTVTVGLVAALTARGFRVGTIKHDVHGFEMDRPGKDSWRHRQAGATATIVTSPDRIGMVMDADQDHQPDELLPLFKRMDIIIAEGFKRARLPKIEVFRPENGKPPACRDDPCLMAMVSRAPLDWGVPRFVPEDAEGLADFVNEWARGSGHSKLL
jgi:molybdopterin-guanine dinucleotide biosynthesis protein B